MLPKFGGGQTLLCPPICIGFQGISKISQIYTRKKNLKKTPMFSSTFGPKNHKILWVKKVALIGSIITENLGLKTHTHTHTHTHTVHYTLHTRNTNLLSLAFVVFVLVLHQLLLAVGRRRNVRKRRRSCSGESWDDACW
jgi:hypothetical protein